MKVSQRVLLQFWNTSLYILEKRTYKLGSIFDQTFIAAKCRPLNSVPIIIKSECHKCFNSFQEYFDDGFKIPTRLLEATYLSLRYDFQANPTEFYKFTSHSPRIRKEDYSVPHYQKICHLRSITNHVATSYILNRLPTNIFFPEHEITIPWHVLLKDIPVATRLTTEPTGQPYTSRPIRAQLHGIPAGINHHCTMLK
jgi:hypothetical protein